MAYTKRFKHFVATNPNTPTVPKSKVTDVKYEDRLGDFLAANPQEVPQSIINGETKQEDVFEKMEMEPFLNAKGRDVLISDADMDLLMQLDLKDKLQKEVPAMAEKIQKEIQRKSLQKKRYNDFLKANKSISAPPRSFLGKPKTQYENRLQEFLDKNPQ